MLARNCGEMACLMAVCVFDPGRRQNYDPLKR